MIHGLIRFAWTLTRKFPALLALNVLLAAAMTLIEATTIFSIAPLVSALQGIDDPSGATGKVRETILSWGIDPTVEVLLLLFASLAVMRELMRAVIQYATLRSKDIVFRKIVAETASNVLDAGSNFLKSQRQGDFVNTMTRELAKVGDSFSGLARSIPSFFQICALIVLPLMVNWKVSLVILILAALLILPVQWLNRTIYARGKENTTTSNNYTVALQETFSQLRLIIGFSKKTAAIERLDSAYLSMIRAHLGLQVVRIITQAVYGPIGVALVVATFFLGRHENLPLSDIIIILFAFHRLSGKIREFENDKNTLISSYPGFEQVQRINAEASASKVPTGHRAFSSLKSELRLTDVSFAYPADNGDQNTLPALTKVSLCIPVGKTVAFVGPSGAGKSTLIDLLLGFLQPQSGAMTIDDTPFAEFDISSLRRRIGFVPQGNDLFHDTIGENVRWGRPDASDADVVEACRLANAHEFITRLDKGYDTIVGDRGGKLSGGQVQRIALARALVRKPDILILDEATSALDATSENQIQESLQAIAGKTTVIIIAHRLATVAKADTIFVFDRGRLIEQGDFASLTDQKGMFSEMVNLQQI